MFTIVKTYNTHRSSSMQENIDTDDLKVNGIWIFDTHSECIYIPFSLCIAIADVITFNDRDVTNQYEMIGHIEIFYDYDLSVVLSDGFESVRIMKNEVNDFSKQLWDLI